jgi:hypothetical protein
MAGPDHVLGLAIRGSPRQQLIMSTFGCDGDFYVL